MYDSYKLFSDMVTAGADVCAGGNREAVGPRGTAAAPPAASSERQLLGRQLISVLQQIAEQRQCTTICTAAALDPVCCSKKM